MKTFLSAVFLGCLFSLGTAFAIKITVGCGANFTMPSGWNLESGKQLDDSCKASLHNTDAEFMSSVKVPVSIKYKKTFFTKKKGCVTMEYHYANPAKDLDKGALLHVECSSSIVNWNYSADVDKNGTYAENCDWDSKADEIKLATCQRTSERLILPDFSR